MASSAAAIADSLRLPNRKSSSSVLESMISQSAMIQLELRRSFILIQEKSEQRMTTRNPA
ncbi:hypothetical protein PGTUg99_035079 [Puccinia graminis f. sp. tritici]|uniref:Uncharacterized protein n=1 Tax=Puccinia graminis f. sp. tritici TaxID=56615 RepID=A0A5B0SNF6_PUCGR|nr:hypothetical protein PGTUg99_035079 [Puccinia graminis f. sp. tritici]